MHDVHNTINIDTPTLIKKGSLSQTFREIILVSTFTIYLFNSLSLYFDILHALSRLE